MTNLIKNLPFIHAFISLSAFYLATHSYSFEKGNKLNKIFSRLFFIAIVLSTVILFMMREPFYWAHIFAMNALYSAAKTVQIEIQKPKGWLSEHLKYTSQAFIANVFTSASVLGGESLKNSNLKLVSMLLLAAALVAIPACIIFHLVSEHYSKNK